MDPDAPKPRLCHLIKWPDFEGFGFNLQLGQFIGKVDDDSPAMMACLREEDRIIEVNGVNISNENHAQVVKRIKAVPHETRLLVVDKETDLWHQERNIIITSKHPNVKYCVTPVPRPVHKISYEIAKSDLNQADEQLPHSINSCSRQDNQEKPLADEILSVFEDKESVHHQTPNDEILEDIISNEMNKAKIEDTNEVVENNNNTEKLNQNLLPSNGNHQANNPTLNQTSNPTINRVLNQTLNQANNQVKSTGKLHNFIVVNSEEQFALEKRLQQLKQQEIETNNLTNHKSSDETTTNPVNNSLNNNCSLEFNKQSDPDLNLNMSVSEMRKLISSRRNLKAEAKKAPIDLRQKYEIIQQM